MICIADRYAALRRFITLTTLFACVLVVVAPGMAHAETAEQLRRRAHAASARIGDLQKSLNKTLAAYGEASRDLRETQVLASKNEKRIKVLDKSIKTNQVKLDVRADYMYRTKGVGFLEALLSSQTFGDFADTMLMLNYVAENDAQLLESLEQEESQRAAARADLKKLLKQQEKTTAARAVEVTAAQKALDGAQDYADGLDDAVRLALERELVAANAKKTQTSKLVKPDTEPKEDKNYDSTGVTFTGLATWYGKGQGTASGERFNPRALTCAHKTLPFDTLVRVTYKGKSVVVRVNDRGPYGKGRVIDLSERAAEIVGLKSAGVGKVTCEIVSK